MRYVITHIQKAVKKHEVTLDISLILWELLKALHVTKQRFPNGTGLGRQSSDGLAPYWVAEKLQPHS